MEHEVFSNSNIELQPLSNKKVWGFATGTLGEYFVYYLFYTYFLYFLTDYVLVPAAIAGTIMSIAMIWDAMTDPIVGYINDVSKNPKGRRRPMMLYTFIPFCLTFFLCFLRPGLEGTALYVYYAVVCLAFWLMFTTQQVPFYGLLPEIAQYDNDRMRIRSAMGFIGNAGNLAVSIVPIALSTVIALGVSEMTAWPIVMGILGVIGCGGFVVCWYTTRGMETPPEKVIRPEGNLFQTYGRIIRLKGYIVTVLVYFICTINLCLIFASIMYVADNKLGLQPLQQSIVVACYTFSGALFAPFIAAIARRVGSLKAFEIIMLIGAILFTLCGFIGLNSFGIMVFHGIVTGGVFALATGFNYGLFYQVIDLAYLKRDEQVEGSAISFATFGYKIGAATAAFFLGIALSIIGYDGASDVNAEVLGRLDSLLTFMPAVLLVIVFLMLVFLYPIKQNLYDLILAAKAKKVNGETYSKEGIEKLF
ncbi:MAG: MFS transporter [Parabacteroides sp.]|nr:MFS transporter [Eubacteriales bacterium]MDD4592293.1 MFS transporter [Parabacteroides sp.]